MEAQKLYRTLEAAAMVGITSKEPKNVRYLFMRIVQKLSLFPADEKTREGGGKPEKFWNAEQIAAIKEYYNAHRRNSSTSEDELTKNNEVDSVPNSPATIEPVATNDETNNDDNPKLSSEEPTANKNDDNFIVSPISETITLDERANRIRKLQADVQRGIIEIGQELIAAKAAVGHGNWSAWLEKEFSWTQRTANNFMRVAERFGKLENVFQFQPSTLQAMLQLPAGDEQEFIEAQTAAGKPIETQSARAVQSAVKQWKNTKEVGRGEYINVTGAEKNNPIVEELNHTTTPTELDSKATNNPTVPVSDFDSNPKPVDDQDTRTIEPDTAANDDKRSVLQKYTIITPEQITAIRDLINQTDDLQTIKAIHDSLLELGREIGEVVLLTEAKIGEFFKDE